MSRRPAGAARAAPAEEPSPKRGRGDPSLPPELIDGVLTPRMQYRLLTCSEVSSDVCRDSMPEFTNFVPMDGVEADEDIFLFDHVPPQLRREVFKVRGGVNRPSAQRSWTPPVFPPGE